MDLNKLQASWNSFPEMSMEERPLLSSDLEKMSMRNPFADPWYLKTKLQARILIAGVLWIFTLWQLRLAWRTEGSDLSLHALTFVLVTWFIYFHVSLLIYAGYPTLSSLQLIPFLTRIETLMEKYMHSFRIISVLAALYAVAFFEKMIPLSNNLYKWLLVSALGAGFYTCFLQTLIPRYKRVMMAVRAYREGIILAKPQKG